MYLKKYHFQKLSVEDKHKMNEAKENERKKRRKRIEILKSNPFPINKNETINEKEKIISTHSISEIEGFFGYNEQMNASQSSLPTVMLIGMVTHRSLSCCDLAELDSTSARDLIRSLAIEKFYKCHVRNSLSLENGGSDECIPGHEQVDVSKHRSLKPFLENNKESYDYIYIDYYQANDAYLSGKMLTETFFSTSIKLL